MSYSLNNAVEEACRRLPEDWTVHLIMEKGSAYVELRHKDMHMITIDGADLTLAEQIVDAIDGAMDWYDG